MSKEVEDKVMFMNFVKSYSFLVLVCKSNITKVESLTLSFDHIIYIYYGERSGKNKHQGRKGATEQC